MQNTTAFDPPETSRIRRRTMLAALAAGLLATSLPTPASAQEKLTIWSGWTELGPFYNRIAEQFKKKYPGVDVSVEIISLREHEKRIALAMPSGAAGDIIEMQVEAPRYVEAGLLPPANASVSAFVADPKHFDKFVQDAVSVNGKVYGMPLFRGQTVLFYNTDMYAKAGLSGPPKTMEDYTTYAEKLTQRDAAGKPTVSGWSLRLSGGGQGIAEKFWINMHQYGGAVVREKGGKWYADYANEAGRKTLKQYLDNTVVKKTVSPEMKADAEAFALGQTAMFIRESWVIGDVAKKAPDLKYATAPLPKGSIVIPVGLYVATKDAKKAQMAWDYTLIANEPENLAWLLDNVGWLPNRKDVDYSAVIKAKPAFDAFVNYPKDHSFFQMPFISPIAEILTRLAARLEKGYLDPALAGNDAAIDAFLKQASDETNTILKREGFYGAP